MSSVLLDDEFWKVETGGAGRTLWSSVTANLEPSNWAVANKRTGEEWRLTEEEQRFLADVAERLNAVQFAPEFLTRSKVDKTRLSQLVLADCLEAIASRRNGDSSKIESLGSLDQPEFTSHVFALWDL